MGGNGGMGLLLMVMDWIIPSFPTKHQEAICLMAGWLLLNLLKNNKGRKSYEWLAGFVVITTIITIRMIMINSWMSFAQSMKSDEHVVITE